MCLEKDEKVEKPESLQQLEDNLNIFHNCVRNCEEPVKDILFHQAKIADIAKVSGLEVSSLLNGMLTNVRASIAITRVS